VFGKLTSQVTLPRDFLFELTGQFFSSKNIGQGRELSRGGIDLGIKKSLAAGRIELNLSATDILNTMGIRQEIDGQGFYAEYQNFYETQIFTIACRYKF
jgi:Outer membrane protein beta-barrel family